MSKRIPVGIRTCVTAPAVGCSVREACPFDDSTPRVRIYALHELYKLRQRG